MLFFFPLAPDGTLYISDPGNRRIRRVDPTGMITTFAGTGVNGFSGDGGPASAAQLGQTRGLALGPDGSLYLADSTFGKIRRIGPDGFISTIATISGPRGLAVGPDDSLYLTVTVDATVRRIGPDGVMSVFAGVSGSFCGPITALCGDGGPAVTAQLSNPFGVGTATDGSVYVVDNNRVRRVGPDGIMTTYAGDGVNFFNGDGGLAPATQLQTPGDVAAGPDGSVYILDRFNSRLRRGSPALKGLPVGQFAVAAEDNSEIYLFDSRGRHLQTRDPLTNATRYQFTYNSANLLTSITDVAGNVTTIERDGSGNATAIVASGGQQTTLTLEGNGYVTSITNPNSEKVELTYAVDGLLATLKDARGNLHTNTYDAQGRLIKDDDPAGGFKALARTDQTTGWTVALSTALNRTTSYQTEQLPVGDQRFKNTDPSGVLTTTLVKANGTTTITAPDGTITTPVQGPDPRFGMQAPLLKSLTVVTPLGLTSTLTTTRAVTLTNPNDSFSLATQTDTVSRPPVR